MFLALNHRVLITGDYNDVGVVSVTSWEAEIHVELLGDTTHTATTSPDDTRVNAVINLH